MNAWENLELFAAFLNGAAGSSWLLAAAVIVVILVGVAVPWTWSRFCRLRSVQEMAEPAHNPDLDRWEAAWRRKQEDDRG
ncbi:hypothetical protein [Nonomuraea sp. NPDC050643]|uniref:hypothetical protein n=1 Tax=Nonomuraea sp. NPDC050643 TaxID=3155660 RepID=UPI0033D3C4E2